jgi:glycerol-3-phosphate dehydrogenase
MEFSPAVRQANIEQMQGGIFDVLVIGGGITGAGIARDAALRGLSVALVEKEDFASGTSSKSARLVHGGFRYLEQFQFGLVISACAERHTLRRIAPRLVTPVPFTFPVYQDSKNGLLKIRLGMWLYDFLALFRNVRRHRILGPQQAAAVEPALNQRGMVGAAYYYDCLADDARLTLATVQSAHRQGALVANYAEVCGLLKDKQISGAEVIDRLTGTQFTVRARVTVNATGVWTNRIRQMDAPVLEGNIRVNRGSHLVLPRQKLGIRGAVTFASADSQRAMYAVPWGETCIVGTTDVDHRGDLDRVYVTASEAESILTSAQKVFPKAKLVQHDVISTFAGLRPLISGEGKAAYQVSRDHHIFESDAGLISIVGGKLTTHRRMAQDVVDVASKKLEAGFGVKTKQDCRSGRLSLAEATFDPELELTGLVEDYAQFDREILTHLALTYGPAASTVLALAKADEGMRCRIVPGEPYIRAEVPYAIQHEMAMTLSDFLIRRTHIIHQDSDQGRGCAASVAAMMALPLEWDATEIERQIERYCQQVELTRVFQG